MMLAPGLVRRSSLITPFPTIWLGRQPKGWSADNIFYTRVKQLQHFSGQEPALTGLIAQGYIFLGHVSQFPDAGGGRKVFAGIQLPAGYFPEIFRRAIPRLLVAGQSGAFSSQMIGLKSCYCRNSTAGSPLDPEQRLQRLRLQQLYNMVVGQRREFYKNLAYNTYAGLFDSNPWKTVKITDNTRYFSLKFKSCRHRLVERLAIQRFSIFSWSALAAPVPFS